MSVPLTVIVNSADEFTKTYLYSDDTFFEQIDEGQLKEEELCSVELDYQMLLLECYDDFKGALPEGTRGALDEFANCVFWSWRDDEGEQQLDVNLESEGLDSSFSPQTSTKLLSLLNAIDWASVESAFKANDVFSSISDFRESFDQWKSILEEASSSGASVFVFLFP